MVFFSHSLLSIRKELSRWLDHSEVNFKKIEKEERKKIFEECVVTASGAVIVRTLEMTSNETHNDPESFQFLFNKILHRTRMYTNILFSFYYFESLLDKLVCKLFNIKLLLHFDFISSIPFNLTCSTQTNIAHLKNRYAYMLFSLENTVEEKIFHFVALDNRISWQRENL